MSENSTLKISARDVNVFYGEKCAIDNVSIDIDAGVVTAGVAEIDGDLSWAAC